jgi:hypothetical protein
MTDEQNPQSQDQPNQTTSELPVLAETRLVDAERLLELIWEERSRPSLRWLRQQQADRTIPFVKVGARVWFDPVEVRAWISEQWKLGKRPVYARRRLNSR